MSQSKKKIVIRCIFLFAAILVVGGMGMGIYKALFVRSALAADGVVVTAEHKKSSLHGKNTTYSWLLMIEFVTHDGKRVSVHTESRASRWLVGQQVGIYYKKQDPSQIILSNFSDHWWQAIRLILFGVGLAIFTGLILLAEARGMIKITRTR